MTRLGPMEMAEIGGVVRRGVLPEGGTLMHCDDEGDAGPLLVSSNQTIAEHVIAELERRGYRIVREGDGA